MTIEVSKQRAFAPSVSGGLVVSKQRAFVAEVSNGLVVTKQRAFVPIIDAEHDRYRIPKAEMAAILDVPEGFSAGKAELGAWLDLPTEASFSKAELGAWLDYTGTTGARRRVFFIN